MTDASAALPPLVTGPRRGLFARLVGTGLAQAGLAVQAVVVIPLVLGPAPSPWVRPLALGGLVAGALVLGHVRARERVLAEQLGQDYVQELRSGLVASALAGAGPSLGTTVARTTNDLSAVRNWVALGVAPLAAAVPLGIGVLGALLWVEPFLALCVAATLAGLGGWLAHWSPAAYARSRDLRRVRGRLAAHLADTVTAAAPIRAGGGSRRELARVRRRGRRVRDAAVARAHVAGALRGGAAAAGGLCTAGVLAVAGWQALPSAQVATALTLVGLLVGPLADLGRVAEYRQSFRAARRVLGPALAAGRTAGRGEDPLLVDPGSVSGLSVLGLEVDGEPVPALQARPGDRVVLQGTPARRQAVLDALLGDRPATGCCLVGSHDLASLGARARRQLLGVARRGWPLERGQLGRAIRYRLPDDEVPVGPTLRAAGLEEVVPRLPEGLETRLRHGGAPLDPSERARVLVARALHGEPAVVVLDRVDEEVGATGRAALRRALADLPGVVVAVTDQPDVLFEHWQEWSLEPVSAGAR